MVSARILGLAAGLMALTACGSGLRDGAYPGEPRFTLAGTIDNILADPNAGTQSLRVTVLWAMVAPPPPATSTSEPVSGEAGPSATEPANPNAGSSSSPAAPTAPSQPTINGQQGGAVNVAFPAPVSLVLYDTPLVSADTPPLQAEGTVVVYYDFNANGQFDAPAEVIAATLQDYRLLFTSDGSGVGEVYVDSILDNPAGTPLSFALATRRCDGGVEHLASVPNVPVSLTPGTPTSCAAP